MHKPKRFPLRISDADRRRAQRLAREMGLSENRFYSDLIQEGLLMREQMRYSKNCAPSVCRLPKDWRSWIVRRMSLPLPRTAYRWRRPGVEPSAGSVASPSRVRRRVGRRLLLITVKTATWRLP